MSSCSTPDCIENMMDSYISDSATCTGASVIKYDFNGREVYVFSQGQCVSDGGATVFDQDCNEICFLGGIVGFTECEGIEFASTAIEIEILYQVK